MTTQKKLAGITPTNDGAFLYVTVHRSRHGWRHGSVRRWPSDSLLRNYLLLHRSVNLALPGHWLRLSDNESTDAIRTRGNHSFCVETSRTEYDHFSGVLRNNLNATFTDDSALATIPVYYRSDAQRSFVSLLNDTASIRLGVVIDGQLLVAVSCRCDSADALRGHLERIRCSVQRSLPRPPFPETVYALNTLPFAFPEAGQITCGSDDPDVLKAIGVAFAAHDQSVTVPRFGDAFPEEKLRGLRLAMVTASLLLLLGTTVLTSLFAVQSTSLGRKVAAAKTSYVDLLNNNNEIRELIASGNALARKVIKINKRVSQPTRWAPFLHELGTKRPEGLFLERLGSEPLSGDHTKIRIALGGWCNSETIATEFIKVLSKSPRLTDVTLSSMERIGKGQSTCRFKIVCVLSTKESY